MTRLTLLLVCLTSGLILSGCIPDTNRYDRTWDDPTAHKTFQQK